MGQAEVTPVEAETSVTHLPHGWMGIEPGRGSRKPTRFRGLIAHAFSFSN
jgi:hypothetical protein